MLGLSGSGFLEQTIITLSEDVLIHKFVWTLLQLQLSFVQSIKRVEYITPNLEFPIKVETCHMTIQQILSMYA